jgi:hypothetical protein
MFLNSSQCQPIKYNRQFHPKLKEWQSTKFARQKWKLFTTNH